MPQAITFDMLAYANKLRDAGVSDKQAQAMAEAQQLSLSQAIDITLATKGDILIVRKDIASLDAQLLLVKWMVGLLLAGVASLILKAFFV